MEIDKSTVESMNATADAAGLSSEQRKSIEELNEIARNVKKYPQTGAGKYAAAVKTFKHAARESAMHIFNIIESLAHNSKEEHIQLAAAQVILDRGIGKSNLTQVVLFEGLARMSQDDAMAYILQEVAAGVVAVETADTLMAMIQKRHDAKTLPEIVARLAALEANLEAKTIQAQSTRHNVGIIEVPDTETTDVVDTSSRQVSTHVEPVTVYPVSAADPAKSSNQQNVVKAPTTTACVTTIHADPVATAAEIAEAAYHAEADEYETFGIVEIEDD